MKFLFIVYTPYHPHVTQKKNPRARRGLMSYDCKLIGRCLDYIADASDVFYYVFN